MQTTIRSNRNNTASRLRVIAVTDQHVIVSIRRKERVFCMITGRSIDNSVDGSIPGRALNAIRRVS